MSSNRRSFNRFPNDFSTPPTTNHSVTSPYFIEERQRLRHVDIGDTPTTRGVDRLPTSSSGIFHSDLFNGSDAVSPVHSLNSPRTPDRPLFNEKWMTTNTYRERTTSSVSRGGTTPTSVTTSASFRWREGTTSPFTPTSPTDRRYSNVSLHSIQDERDGIQKKTFTKWVNKHLKKAGKNVDDLFRDLQDGNNLISLLEVLSDENLRRENGYTRFHRIQNVQYCLDWIRKRNIRFENIRPEDIVDGSGKLTLGLIWTIILHFQVSVIKHRQRAETVKSGNGVYGNGTSTPGGSQLDVADGGTARDALLQWARRATEGYPRVNVTNFSSSWRDGLAFNAILHRYRPKAINWEQISDPSVSNRERLQNAFEVAKREFDVDKLLDAEDVDVDHPDEKSIITYVSSLYNNLPNMPELSKGSLADLISRLTRGIGITNEKLDLILLRIEDVESRVDTDRPAEIERAVNAIVDDLNALESPIAGFFEDVETLKQHDHPEASSFYKQVYGLHQRRTAYLDRLTNQLLVRLGVRTETMRRQTVEQTESQRKSRFGRVEDCIQWVRSHMERLVNMQLDESLEVLEQMFEKHKIDNRDIQDFRQEVDSCIARQSEINAEDSVEYCELLRVLESEYQQLRDLSAGRMLDLDSLIAFLRAAQQELVWVNEREDIEVHRNWSDIKQLDLPMLTNYYKQLLHEMELREPQYNDVHNKGAALLNQGHPAIKVIEVYIETMKKQWDWLLNLSRCLEQHLRDALNLKAFTEEAEDAEAWIKEQFEFLDKNYNRSDFTLEEGERMLRELDEMKEILNKYQSVLHALSERCATISPLWQRGERISKPMTVTALCDFEDANVHIRAGDDIILIDNSNLVQWKIQDVSERQGVVPSVVFRIPPPDTRLTAWLTRLLQQFEKLRKIWDLKHRMIRFYMVLNTMKTIQGWDVNMFNSLDPEQRDAIIKALNDDTNKLLSELDPNDPLAQRLRDELKKTMDHFWSLFNQAQRAPESDLSNEFDQLLADLLRKLEEAWRALKERTGRPIPRTAEDLERALREQREFEELLQSLDGDVNNLKDIFSKLSNPTPSQRVNMERVNVLWDDSWDLSRMYVERMKVLDAVIAGIFEVKDIVRAHEITLNSFDDLPCALDRLRGEHAQLLELNMVLQQQQTVIDQLNRNVALLRQHVARTRLDTSSHPDVDRLEEEVQALNVRWENVQTQIADRLKATERALQVQMVYRSEYENEMAWLDRVEDTINKLRRPEELRPEQYQQQLDLLVAEYAQLQERTEAIENVNREGGKYIREAKGYDGRLKQFGDIVVGIHGRDVTREFRRTQPQPKSGAQIVTEELEALNRRFAQLSSLILEKRNVMQVLIQNWKRQKQDTALREAMNQQAQIGDLLSDLNSFEERIYHTHLSFDLNRQSAENSRQGVEELRGELDEWADRVRTKLEMVDRLCVEGADTLTPEQFAALKETRSRLERNYETVVRTVENLQTRLNAIAQLVIEFSSRASEMHSWITDGVRKAGEIRVASSDPVRLPEERRRAKALMDDIAGKETELKALNALFARIDAEIEQMYAETPGASDRVIHSGDVRDTLMRVETDYTELYRQAADLGVFQQRVGALGEQADDSTRRTNDWLARLERNLSEQDGPTVEQRLRRAEEMKDRVAADLSLLDDSEQAGRRLLNALEGTPAHAEVKERQDRAMQTQRQRHSDVLERVQQKVNDSLAEKATADGVKAAVEDLAEWTSSFGKKVDGATRKKVPLRPAAVEQLKSEEQGMRSELEAHSALAKKLEGEVAKASSVSSALSGLSDQLDAAMRRLSGSNSALTGWRDNLQDAGEGLKRLEEAVDTADRAADQIGSTLRNAPARDANRLAEIERDVEALASHADHVSELAKKLLGLPEVTEKEVVEGKVAGVNRRLDSLGRDLTDKRGQQEAIGHLEETFDRLKEQTSESLSDLRERMAGLAPVALDSNVLRKQRGELDELESLCALAGRAVDELEELEGQLVDTGASSGAVSARGVANSASAKRRELADKYKAVSDGLRKRGDSINKNEAAVKELQTAAEDLLQWCAKEAERIRTECPIPLSADDSTAVQRKLDRFEKDIRNEQRKKDDSVRKASELTANNLGAPGAEEIGNIAATLEDEWNNLGDELDSARRRARSAEQLQDKAAGLSKWMAASGRHLAAIGPPSTDPAAVRAQKAQIEIIKAGIDDEKPVWQKVNDLAADLVREAPNGANHEGVVKMTDDLNKRWTNLGREVEKKEKQMERVAKDGGHIHSALKDLKKEMGELEGDIDRVAKMPSGEGERQMQALDGLSERANKVADDVGGLEKTANEIAEEDVDPVHWSDVTEAIGASRNRADEISKRLEGVRAATLSARDKEQELGNQLDELLDASNRSRVQLDEAGEPTADAQKVAEGSEKMDALVAELLARDGEAVMARMRAKEHLATRPDDTAIRNKSDLLAIEWSPLLDEARGKKATLAQVGDLLRQFEDLHDALEKKTKEGEEEMARLQSAAAAGDEDAVRRLKELEASADRRGADSDALDKLAERIETLAPGGDARKLKRKSEQLGEDVRGQAKKAKAAIAGASRKNDLRGRLSALLSDANQFIDGHEADLDERGEKMGTERIAAKQHEISAYCNRAERELRVAGDELKEASPESTDAVDGDVNAVAERFVALLERVGDVESRLNAQRMEGEEVRGRTASVGGAVARLCEEMTDTAENVGRSAEELRRNEEECDHQEKEIEEREREIDEAQKALLAALEAGIITPAEYEKDKASLDDSRRALDKARKRLGQRRKRIQTVADEIDRLQGESEDVCGALLALGAAPILSIEQAKGDPATQAAALKEMKEQLRPLSDRVQKVVTDCQALIKSAPPEVNTKELDGIQKETGVAHERVAAKMEEREREVDAAAQQMGKYEDAYKALLNWLEETEEMMDNQPAPSADAKVARAQRATFDVFLKHLEDKQTSVDGFAALIGKLQQLTSSEEEKAALGGKAEQIANRYSDLLGSAQDGQARLRDAVELAERYTAVEAPLRAWLAATEKTINGFGQIPLDTEKLDEQRAEQQRLQADIEDKAEDVKRLQETAGELAALVSVEDATDLTTRAAADGRTYDGLAARCKSCGDSIDAVAQHLGVFLNELDELESWLTDLEVNMLSLDDLAIHDQDELAEQANLLSELGIDVTEHEPRFADVIAVGVELCRQTSRDEAIALQRRIDAMKMRFSEVSGVTDEKLELMEKAIPLAERFHDGFESAMEWIEAVEDDLRILDEAPLDTQLQIVLTIEEDLSQWRPDIDSVIAMSTQLQGMTSAERANDLHAHTSDMNRRANAIAEQVSRRTERLLMAEKQSRGVIDELDFVSEWLEEAKEKVQAAAPPSIVVDYVKTQLKNQRLLNEDVGTQRSKLRDVTAEAKKLARQVGDDAGGAHGAALLAKAEGTKALADEVGEVCEKRAELLEQGLALAQQLESGHDDVQGWLDEMEKEIENAPSVMTGTAMAALAAQQRHNMELSAAITAQRPLMERFEKDIAAFQEMCHTDDAGKLEDIKQEVALRFAEIKENVKARGDALDQVMDLSAALGERLDAFIAALTDEASRLRADEPMTSDVVALEGRVADTRALKEGLRQKTVAMNALRDRAEEILAHAAPGDASAQEVAAKIQRMEDLWADLARGAENKDRALQDALEKAKRFWRELAVCERALDDLKRRLDDVEPAVGQPEILQEQTNELDSIAGDAACMPQMVDELMAASADLCALVPGDEQVAINGKVDGVAADASTITALCAAKYADLGRALEEAMAFHSDIASLSDYLTAAEAAFLGLPPIEELPADEVADQLEAVQAIRGDLDNGSVLREELARRANQLSEGAPAHQVAAIRQPVAELTARWSRLTNGLAEREHAINKSLLEKGQLLESAQQMLLWMEKTQSTLSDLAKDGPTNLRQIEIALCKLAVVRNDVQAHEPSIIALNRALRSSEDVDPRAASVVDEINVRWSGLLKAIEEIGARLDKAKAEAENVGGEMEKWAGWADDVAAQLEPRRALAGVPETAREQLDEFRVTKAEMEQSQPALEAYLRATEDYLAEHAEGETEQSWLGRNHAKLANKWAKIKDLAETRERKLLVAQQRAEQLDGELVDIRGWLDGAEKGLTEAGPVSRMPDALRRQQEDQEDRMADIDQRRMQFADTKSLAGAVRAACEAKDAIYVKNQTVSLEARLNKYIARANDRGKQLDTARSEMETYLDGVEGLNEWMDEANRHLSASPPATSDLERLKTNLEQAKDLLGEVSSRKPQYEMTRKRGISLGEHTTKAERKEIEKTNEEMKKKWDAIQAAAETKAANAEKAVLESGRFSEALSNLEEWLHGEAAEASARRILGVKGDVDTVRELLDAEKKRADGRKKKAENVAAVAKKAKTLVADGVEEGPEVEAAVERMEKKWTEIEEDAAERKAALDDALNEAESFDAKVHALLDWLAATEAKLKVPANGSLSQSIAAATAVRNALEMELPRLKDVQASAASLLDGCHPSAEAPLKDWQRVVAARWKEVEERAEAKEDSLREEDEQNKQREATLHELNDFVEKKRLELDENMMMPPVITVEEAEERQRAHSDYEEELKKRQADVDAVTKGRRRDGQKDKNAEVLADKWRRLWGDSMGHADQLEKDRAHQEELRRLEGWTWDGWRDRYVEWNDHGKARVNDLFRRIGGRSSTGNVPRQHFIDAVVASKFPSSRLEMEKVADRFDKGDGLIPREEFIKALKITNKRPVPKTEDEQREAIRDEMTRRREQCSCAHKFRIELDDDGSSHMKRIPDGGFVQTYRFGDQQIKKMVRILNTTVMVRVGGGWEPLDVFLDKHDPCQANSRKNTDIYSQFYNDVRPVTATDKMYTFTKLRHARSDYEASSPTSPGPSTSGTPGARRTPVVREEVQHLRPFAQPGTPGPSKGLREKTSTRSVPMFGENRFETQKADSNEDSRPSSRASSITDSTAAPTRIPSIRGKKGQKYNPPSARK